MTLRHWNKPKNERWILAGYTHYLKLGLSSISQLLGLGEGSVGIQKAIYNIYREIEKENKV
jgi:hypothetical protein